MTFSCLEKNHDPLPERAFVAFRAIFGLYLVFHFGSLIPWADELFGPAGLLGQSGANPYWGRWPNPLFSSSTSWPAATMVIVATIGGGLIASGICRRFAAIIIALIHACLLTMCPLMANPALPYIGLLLWLLAIIPPGERWIPPSSSSEAWQIPSGARFTAGFLLAAGYTISGVSKLSSPGWIDGTALSTVLGIPLARATVPSWLLTWPPLFLKALTWSTLVLEGLYLPIWFITRWRTKLWLAMMGLHLGILFCLDFADLTLGMIMIHLFVMPKSLWTLMEKMISVLKVTNIKKEHRGVTVLFRVSADNLSR